MIASLFLLASMSRLEIAPTVRSLRRQIFRPDPPDEFCRFNNTDWSELLLEEGILDSVLVSRDIDALLAMAELGRDREIFVASAEPDLDEQRYFNVGCTRKELEPICHELLLTSIVVFGRSAMWGVYSHAIGFTVVGGRSKFLEAFCKVRGSPETIQSEFEEFVSSPRFSNVQCVANLKASCRWPHLR